MRIEADAPGKLVLFGDYAVLRGYPGIAAAVDVRARARIERMPGTGCLFVVDGVGSFSFRWVPAAGVRWEGNEPGDFGLVLECAVATLGARGLMPLGGALLPACRIELSTVDFQRQDADGRVVKLGLGSSAGVVVALAGALLQLLAPGALDRQRLLAIACDTHRLLQGGAGSGIDVAAALAGGIVAVEFAGPGEPPRPTPLAWPRSLRLVPVWSGRSASTGALLGRLRAAAEANPAAHAAHLQRLGAIAVQALGAWRGLDAGAIVAAAAAYDAALRQLDEEARIGIYTRDHERLRGIALAAGAGAYKTSGAGGGDFGIAFTDSKARVHDIRAAFAAAGYASLDAPLGAPGLSVSGGIRQAGRSPPQ